MPLLSFGAYQNPIALALPAPPVAGAAPSLAPAQGDHVFGDVIGTIETALQSIFGGGANWRTRMHSFNPVLATLWAGLAALDFGHGANPPIVTRAGAPEPDEHSHLFGGYSQRFQWQLCELVCTGYTPGAGGNNIEVRLIGGATKAWRKKVLASFDDLLAHLVDSTALAFYIATPNAVRAAAPNAIRHPAVSLVAANTFAAANHGTGRARVNTVLAKYTGLRSGFESVLSRLESEGGTRTFDPVNDTWS
ncbi:hypothetical protein R0381_002675 [Jeongeupia wiesaeckerbachi]|uniref:hypothetical protein n=1 Tax=Jeongeupia wiesaeckerbachi TaxID=3051218 RepID=UPI003D807609